MTLLLAIITASCRDVVYFGARGQVFLVEGGIFVSDVPAPALRGHEDWWSFVPAGAFWQRVRVSFWSPVLGSGTIWVPLGLPLPVVGAVTAVLWHRDRRRVPPGRCRRCGYDLTGNVSGICPECGKAIKGRLPLR